MPAPSARDDSPRCPAPPCRVAAVDDHELVRHGLARVLGAAPDVEPVALCPSVADLLAGPGAAADVVLLDLVLPGERDVADNVARLRATGAQVVIVTSDHRPALARRALRAGALALVLKDDPAEELLAAIRAARAGEHHVSGDLAHAIVADERAGIALTVREHQALTQVARGMTHRQVARHMGISAATVPEYLKRVAARYAAVGVHGSPGELAVHAVLDGHVELRDPR